jgi:hypothetical protein
MINRLICFFFIFFYFLFSIFFYHNIEVNGALDCHLYRTNNIKSVCAEILDGIISSDVEISRSSEDIFNYIDFNIDIYALFFFYNDEQCPCCFKMREMLVDFMLKYTSSFVYAIPLSNKISIFTEFCSFDITLSNDIFEWVKPVPSLLLYDCISEDAVFISNSNITLKELEIRLMNYMTWADKVEDGLFTKIDFMFFVDELNEINYSEFSYIYFCRNGI